eukprot:1438562-Amphidinium_carterae.1
MGASTMARRCLMLMRPSAIAGFSAASCLNQNLAAPWFPSSENKNHKSQGIRMSIKQTVHNMSPCKVRAEVCVTQAQTCFMHKQTSTNQGSDSDLRKGKLPQIVIRHVM